MDKFLLFDSAEIEEMAQQADRMRISEKKHIRERRPSNGSSADSGTGGFPVCKHGHLLSTLVFKDPEFGTVSYILCLA